MEESQIIASEWNNHGSTWTNNKQFDEDGYYVVKNLWMLKNSIILYH